MMISYKLQTRLPAKGATLVNTSETEDRDLQFKIPMPKYRIMYVLYIHMRNGIAEFLSAR